MARHHSPDSHADRQPRRVFSRRSAVRRAAAASGAAGLACLLLAGPGLAGPGPSGPDPAGTRAYGDARARSVAPAAAGQAPGDDLPGPYSEQRRTRRDAAVTSVVTVSQSAGVGPHRAPDTVQLPQGPKVQLRPPSVARVFVILVEFGDKLYRGGDPGPLDPAGPGQPQGVPGPRHDQIPQPNRRVDTETIWVPHFDRGYFRNLFLGDGSAGGSLATHYRAQSSGRMNVEGAVADWVRVPWNEARYGSGSCGAAVCTNVWDLVRDALDTWYDGQIAAGKSEKQIDDYLRQFDRWDRDDHDGNGTFDQPDGYIDHLEIVKAGVDKAAGGGASGTNAIWSHRWYAYSDGAGRTGPPGHLAGGTRIGRSGLWAGDYTIQSENGGLGTIAHEFGHDLGLPDLYDRKDGLSGSPVAFWSLMSIAGYLSNGRDGTGSSPGSLSAWDRIQLGWLDWMVADPGATTSLMIAPLQSIGDPQAVLIPLQPKHAGGKPRWYIVENRQYTGTDAALRTGPYDRQPGAGESDYFPYGPGVLVWLWDTGMADNDVADHPGQGLILPVDAHPAPLLAAGAPVRARIQMYDAAFGLPGDTTDPVSVGNPGARTALAPKPGQPVFDDKAPDYWSSRAPLAGVKLPGVGVRVEVQSAARKGDAVRVTVGPAGRG